MKEQNISPEIESAIPNVDADLTPPVKQEGKLRVFLHRWGIKLIGAIIIVILGVLVYNWLFVKAKVVYNTAIVQRGDVETTVVAAGVVQPIKYVDVGAQTSGKLKTLKVNRGDKVVIGQLLAEIDPILAKSALTSSDASLENMTSLRKLKEAQLVLTRLQKDRNDKLYALQLISASDRDIAKTAYDIAFADSASLAAQMKQANASVNTAKANLSYTNITAPMAGQIVSITALEGQTLNANQSAPVILRIANLDTVTVWSQVSEADIDRVKVDQKVYFTVLGESQRWDGQVRQILPTPELINNVVFYDVLFDMPNPKGDLYIQMTAQVFIVLEQAKGVLLIPTAAVGNAIEGAEIQIQVLKEDGKLQLSTIKIGIKGEIMTEVKDGLKEKEVIVIGEIKGKKPAVNKSALSAKKGL